MTKTFNFKNVSAFEVDPKRISSFTFDDIELEDERGEWHNPTLYGVCAGDGNKKMRARVTKANAKRGGGNRKLNSAKTVKYVLDNVREFFGDDCLTGWDDVYDGATHKPVKFSPEAATAFLVALPDWALLKAAEYFTAPENFAGPDGGLELSKADVEETAGN